MPTLTDIAKENNLKNKGEVKSFLDRETVHKKMNKRLLLDKVARKVFSLSIFLPLVVLGILFYRIGVQSVGWLNLKFLTSNLSIFPDKAGIYGVIAGSTWLMAVVIPVTLLLGVSTALYLEEYASKGRFQAFVKINISNLAGVPSVIFGLLGLTVFGRLLRLGSSILAGGLTLSLLVLPIIVVTSQEAIKAIPKDLRDGAYAMGATKWTAIRTVVLPAALPGILTGCILAVSRAIGETAPLVVLGIPTLIRSVPNSIMSDFTALPIQIYYWTLDTVLTAEYANLAAATIVVLLMVLFLMNSAAIIIRNKYQRRF